MRKGKYKQRYKNYKEESHNFGTEQNWKHQEKIFFLKKIGKKGLTCDPSQERKPVLDTALILFRNWKLGGPRVEPNTADKNVNEMIPIDILLEL